MFLILNASLAFSQAPENKIFWRENPVLEWEDFIAAPNSQHPFDAMTNSGISYSWSFRTSKKGKEFIFTVKSYFAPAQSWVKNGEKSAYLLAHEQLHFDISELHARKLRKAIQEYKIGPNIKKDLRDIFDSIQVERAGMQEKFDLESQHSMDTINEAKWQKQIGIELEKLKKYHSD